LLLATPFGDNKMSRAIDVAKRMLNKKHLAPDLEEQLTTVDGLMKKDKAGIMSSSVIACIIMEWQTNKVNREIITEILE